MQKIFFFLQSNKDFIQIHFLSRQFKRFILNYIFLKTLFQIMAADLSNKIKKKKEVK